MAYLNFNEGFMDLVKKVIPRRKDTGKVTVSKREIAYDDIPKDIKEKLRKQGMHEESNFWESKNVSDPSQKGKNAIDIPNYGKDHSITDGDDPETFKVNIPAAVAAKTAGGAPFEQTLKNGISNHTSSDVFKIKNCGC